MKTKFKKLSDSRAEITVTLDAKETKSYEDKAIKSLAKEVKVEGFRKGKTPVEIAKKFITQNDIDHVSFDYAVRETATKAINEHKQMPLTTPNVTPAKQVPGELIEYTITIDVVPEIKLGDYKKLGVKRKEVKITEKDINGALDNIAGSFAEKKVTKRPAKLGDEVIIDFVGKKDGEPFQGGSAKDYPLTLGSKAFIPGFEDGIVGHEPGDKFDLKLTFPKDYGMKDLAGAEVVFETLVKQINEIIKPKIDDELAKKCGPFKNLDELKKDIEKNLKAQSERQNENVYKNALVEALVKKSKVSAPEILIEDQMKMIREDVERNAASMGMSFEDYIKRAGLNTEKWEKEAHEIAEQRVKGSLVLQALAVQEKITVSDELVDARIAELKEVYKKSPEAVKSFKDPNVKNNIRNHLILEETLNFLVKANS